MRLAWRYLPVGSAGGDLFAVAPWGSDALGCFILDASGHGHEAAARASALADLLVADLPREMPAAEPGQILTMLNQQFPMTKEGHSLTIWLGIVSVSSGRLRFSSAGHAGVLVLHEGSPSEQLSRPSFPLGFVPHGRYSTMTATLRSGDRLLMFSDGLYDAAAPTGERWGLSRFQFAVRHHADLGLPEHLDAVIADARAWQQGVPFRDDAAMVGLEIGSGD